MRISFRAFLSLSILFPWTTYCEELIPGLVSFDKPSFLVGTVPLRAVAGEIRQYCDYRTLPGVTNMMPSAINIMVKDPGSFVGQKKVVTNQELDEKALREWMQNVVDSTRSATNIGKVADSEVGGQVALRVSYQVIQTHWAMNTNAVFSFELYWIRIPTNRVLEIKLVADSPEHLETLKPCLSRFAIKKTANPQGGANGSQPLESETNKTSAAAASRRSP